MCLVALSLFSHHLAWSRFTIFEALDRHLVLNALNTASRIPNTLGSIQTELPMQEHI